MLYHTKLKTAGYEKIRYISTADRNDAVEFLLEMHPCVVWHFVELGLFRTRQGAHRFLKSLEEKGKVRSRVSQASSGGRPPTVYFKKGMSRLNLEHEVNLTTFCFCYSLVAWRCLDWHLYHDAEIRFGENKYYIELDMGTEWGKKIDKTVEKYIGSDQTVLFATTTCKREDYLRKRFRGLDAPVFFSRMENAHEDPWGWWWWCKDGEFYRMEKPETNPRQSDIDSLRKSLSELGIDQLKWPD